MPDTQAAAPETPTAAPPPHWAALTITVGGARYPMSVGYRMVDKRVDLNAGWYPTARNSVRPRPQWVMRAVPEIAAVQVGSGQNVLPLLSTAVREAIRNALSERQGAQA